ncbi:MAG: hypothetical protein LBH74_01710 [Nitrososphaerota archaeon]|jgi:hypothetical protein|nr:hypothetical protein [Nitrososphaerota archaeon]
MDIIQLLIQIVISVIVISPILWLVGRALAGKHNAKFTDAIWIVVLGTVIGTIVGALIGGLVGGFLSAVIMLFVWLGLIKHFFDCGWIKAFAIAVITVIVFVVIVALLALIGIGIGALGI